MRIAAPLPIRTPIAVAGEHEGFITKGWADYFQSLSAATVGITFGTHAERISSDYDPLKHPIGTQFYEIDRGLLYVNVQSRVVTFVDVDSASGTAVLNVDDTTGFTVGQTVYIGAGTAREEKRAVASISAGVSLTFTRNLTYTHTAAQRDYAVAYSTAREWNYTLGTMSAPLDQEPTDLGASDAGVLYQVTTGTGGVEYYHTARWTGTAWEAADRWGGYVEHYLITPIDKGWHLCDGTGTKYLSISAGALAEVNVTPVNETTGVYRKSGAAYSGAITPSTAPSISGSTASESSHTHSVDPPSSSTGFPTSGLYAGTVGGAGSFAGSDHVHQVDIPAFTSGAGSAHSHGAGTLAVDATAEPAHTTYKPYFRR